MKKYFILLMTSLILSTGASVGAIENIVSLDDIEPAKTDVKPVESEKTPKVLQAKVTFDWLDLNSEKKQERIEYYKNLLFTQNKSHINYSKDEFKEKFAQYFKDKNFKHHYMLTNNGVTEDEEAQYCAFYYKKNTLIMYAIQYKDTPRKAFYYTAFGKLYYTDLMSDEYPNFPYTSMQYDRKGNLKSSIYFVSKDLQYMYGPDKEFQGVWYKEKMYDKDGKQVATRTNW